MPHYKLTYFDITGIAEPIRYLMCILGEEFEEHRVKLEDWPSLKPTTPFGKVPVLEVDGKAVCQCTAICRYLGKKAKLAGKDEWEDLQIDMIVDTLTDLRQAVSEYYWSTDEISKPKMLEVLKKETLPFYFERFDKIVKNNGYLANGKLSWGDIFFVGILFHFHMYAGGYDYKEHFENLKGLHDKIMALPEIKKWIQSRGNIAYGVDLKKAQSMRQKKLV